MNTTPEHILGLLMKRSFHEWYLDPDSGDLCKYIEGIEDAPNKDEILKQIKNKFEVTDDL